MILSNPISGFYILIITILPITVWALLAIPTPNCGSRFNLCTPDSGSMLKVALIKMHSNRKSGE